MKSRESSEHSSLPLNRGATIYGRTCSLTSDENSSVICGRIESASSSIVVVRTNFSPVEIRIEDTHTMTRGDIVEMAVVRGQENRLSCVEYRILVRPSEDPLVLEKSLYNTLGRRNSLLAARDRMLKLTRSFFSEREFMELSTPSLVTSPGMESNLSGFETIYQDHQGESIRYFMPTSPEFALKKALCSGFEKIFEIRPVYRNRGELGPLHQPEFTILEWYRAFEDYERIMDDTEELLAYLAREMKPYITTSFREAPLRWDPPYPRMSVTQAFHTYAGINLMEGLQNSAYFFAKCRLALKRALPQDENFSSLFHRVMIELIEPNLGVDKPALLFDYPAQLSALAILKRGQPLLSERFELYVGGIELANAFTELNDPGEMAKRIRSSRQAQRTAGFEPSPADGELLRAMRQGMPPAGGIALGIDRLLMTLVGENDIAMVIPFPMNRGGVQGQTLSDLR